MTRRQRRWRNAERFYIRSYDLEPNETLYISEELYQKEVGLLYYKLRRQNRRAIRHAQTSASGRFRLQVNGYFKARGKVPWRKRARLRYII